VLRPCSTPHAQLACSTRRENGSSARVWNEWLEQLRRDWKPGVIAPARKFVGGADDIRYGNDFWRLADDEAMIIETELPRARYWQIQLCDPWFETMDYANRQTSLNGRQAHVDSDGRFRCVVAHRDPGVPNWLDTSGHHEGMLQYRWVWTETNPEPTARIVKERDVRAMLPPDTPHVAPEARREAIRIRQEHVARREPAS